ncbi:MAG: SDR family oxidoreductase [Alphaproteobacteria bacterium]
MPTALIIGASRGIGLNLADQYAADGWQVHATHRGDEPPAALAGLAGDIHCHRLDVTDAAQIAALAGDIATLSVDLCIHNAGIADPHTDFGELDAARWQQVLQVNTIAPIMVAQAVIGRVLASRMKTFAFISSEMGSIGRNDEFRAPIYRSSKAALNAGVRCLANQYRSEGLIAVVMHPGWVRTDMGGPGATLSTEQSSTGIRKVIAGLSPQHSGRFWNYDGAELAW